MENRNTVAEYRPIPILEQDILFRKNRAGMDMLEIGRDLIEAKAQLNHGEWGAWLRDKVDFSASSAKNFMRIAREVDEGSALASLPYTKVLALLELPAEERETFAQANNVIDLNAGEIKKLIRERDQAREELRAAREGAEKEIARLNQDWDGITQDKIREIKKLRQALEDEKAKPAQVVEQIPADYLRSKSELEALRERLARAEEENDRLADQVDRMKTNNAASEETDLMTRILSAIGGLMAQVGGAPEQLRRNPEQLSQDDWSLLLHRTIALGQWCDYIRGACPWDL